MKTLPTELFATLTEITPQAAREAFRKASEGKTWRGHDLPVIALSGQRGGAGGVVWGLVLDRCSPDLKALLGEIEAPVETVLEEAFQSIGEERFRVQSEKLGIIRPILATSKQSKERAEAFRAVARDKHMLRGTLTIVAEPTLRDWVRAFEEKGTAGLLPTQRGDKGKPKALMSRKWDGAIDLPGDAQAEIARQIETKALSMIANDGTSEREVVRLCEIELRRACVAAGSQLGKARLSAVCRLSRRWAQRFHHYRLVHMQRKDHKAWQDTCVPRIGRALHPRPMGLLIGDVHYVDILVEEGKEPVRARLIAWMDASSMYAWVTPVFLGKGRGVRQEDVAQSLAQVSLCPHGGIPEEYYLDNGSEYAALTGAMQRLSALADMRFKVTLAKPYSPTSKGEIEGFFNVLEGIFKGLPGWIGGDRTNKKSANKGKVIQPYKAGLDQLEADILAAVAIYNDRPQSGRLNNFSPLEMLEKKIEETGFEARIPDDEAFDIIFSREETRSVRQGSLEIGGERYHGSFLGALLPKTKVTALVPLRGHGERVFVKHKGKELGWADLMPTIMHGDGNGARLQATLEQGVGRVVRDMEKDVDPGVSTFAIQKAAVEKIAPNAAAPAHWTRAIDKTAPKRAETEEEALERDIAQFRKGKSFLTDAHMRNLDRATGGAG